MKENRITAFKRLSECFIIYGTVKEKKRTRRKTATNDENAINILAAIQLNPTSSIRQLERECELVRNHREYYMKTNFIHITFTCIKI